MRTNSSFHYYIIYSHHDMMVWFAAVPFKFLQCELHYFLQVTSLHCTTSENKPITYMLGLFLCTEPRTYRWQQSRVFLQVEVSDLMEENQSLLKNVYRLLVTHCEVISCHYTLFKGEQLLLCMYNHIKKRLCQTNIDIILKIID